MQSYKLILLYLFFSFFILNNTSCNRKNSKDKFSSDLRLNFIRFPTSLDPRHSTEAITNSFSFMIYEGLTHLEPNGEVSLALAEKITISSDQKEYLFTLRPSYWSNGDPVTAYDFEDSWKQVLSPLFNSSAAELLYPIKNAENLKKNKCSVNKLGVKALNKHTLKVELEYPTPHFLHLTAYPTYFPVSKKGGTANLFSNQAKMITNGPFKLVSWKNKHEIHLEKNPYFWAEKDVKIKQIHIINISDEVTSLYLFEKNKLDWVGGYLSPLPLNALEHLKKFKLLKTHQTFGATLCFFNVTKHPLNNLNIRKALSYAIDPTLFIDGFTQLPINFLTPESHIDRLENKQELAQKYFELGLQELGILKKDFPILVYSHISHEIQRNVAMILQNQWKKVLDLHIELETNEPKTFFSKLLNGKFMLTQTSWIFQYPDIMAFFARLGSNECLKNFGKWENSLYKNLVEQYNYSPLEDRLEYIEKGKQILEEEVPIIPLYHFCLTYIQNPDLKNVTISPLGHPHFRKAYFDL